MARRGSAAVLVDLDPYGGAVAQQLGILDEVSGLLSASRLAGSGNLEDRFASVCRGVGDHLAVVTGLPRAERWREVRGAHVERLLEAARNHGDVVVDTGFSIEEDSTSDFGGRPGRNTLTLSALDSADEVIVVGAADPVGLARLARGLVELRDRGTGRTGPGCRQPDARLIGWSEKDIAGMVEGFTRAAGLHFLPDDGAGVDKALVTGRALAEGGDSSLVRSLAALTDAVFPATSRHPEGGSCTEDLGKDFEKLGENSVFRSRFDLHWVLIRRRTRGLHPRSAGLALMVVALTATPALAANNARGTTGNDTITGNSRPNHIMSLGGRDQVRGYGGGDTIYAGNGDDTVYGDSGDDWMTAQPGNDWVAGGLGNDKIDGGSGDDVLYGGEGDDAISSNVGNDTVYGESGNDLLGGNDGDDRLFGGEGTDKHIGGAGNDWIDGGPGDDNAIQGGPGNDVLIDGEGHDWLIKGDEGDDVIFLGPGADKVFSEQGNDTIYVLPDGSVDKIRCDDGGQDQGDHDQVVFVGWRDPLDVVDPFGTCESVSVVQELPGRLALRSGHAANNR